MSTFTNWNGPGDHHHHHGHHYEVDLKGLIEAYNSLKTEVEAIEQSLKKLEQMDIATTDDVTAAVNNSGHASREDVKLDISTQEKKCSKKWNEDIVNAVNNSGHATKTDLDKTNHEIQNIKNADYMPRRDAETLIATRMGDYVSQGELTARLENVKNDLEQLSWQLKDLVKGINGDLGEHEDTGHNGLGIALIGGHHGDLKMVEDVWSEPGFTKVTVLDKRMSPQETNIRVKIQKTWEFIDAIKAQLDAYNVIDFTKWWEVKYPVDRLDKFSGVFRAEGRTIYILGHLSNRDAFQEHDATRKTKSATVFLKYMNGAPFDAIIDISGGNDTGVDHILENGEAVVDQNNRGPVHGSMNVQVSFNNLEINRAPEDLQFHLFKATTQDGKIVLTLGVSSKLFASDGIFHGVNTFGNLRFYVAGINFIPYGAGSGAPQVEDIIEGEDLVATVHCDDYGVIDCGNKISDDEYSHTIDFGVKRYEQIFTISSTVNIERNLHVRGKTVIDGETHFTNKLNAHDDINVDANKKICTNHIYDVDESVDKDGNITVENHPIIEVSDDHKEIAIGNPDQDHQVVIYSTDRPVIDHANEEGRHQIAYLEDVKQSIYWKRTVNVIADTIDNLNNKPEYKVWVDKDKNIVSSDETKRPVGCKQVPGIYYSDPSAEQPAGHIFNSEDVALITDSGTDWIGIPEGKEEEVTVRQPAYACFKKKTTTGFQWGIEELIEPPLTGSDRKLTEGVFQWSGFYYPNESSFQEDKNRFLVQAYVHWSPHQIWDGTDKKIQEIWSYTILKLDPYRTKAVQDTIDKEIVDFAGIQPDCAETQMTLELDLPERPSQTVANPAFIHNLPWQGIADVDGGSFIHNDYYIGYKIDCGDYSGVEMPTNAPMGTDWYVQNAVVRLAFGEWKDQPEISVGNKLATMEYYARSLRWTMYDNNVDDDDNGQLVFVSRKLKDGPDGKEPILYRFAPIQSIQAKKHLDSKKYDPKRVHTVVTEFFDQEISAGPDDDSGIYKLLFGSTDYTQWSKDNLLIPHYYHTTGIIDINAAVERHVEVERQERIKEIARVDERIDKEIERATKRENELNEKLDNEINAEGERTTALEKKLDEETKRAIESEDILGQKLQEETKRATDSENKLADKINAEGERTTALEKKLDEETKRAIESEDILGQKLQSEVSRATDEERMIVEHLRDAVNEVKDTDNARMLAEAIVKCLNELLEA